MNKVVRKLYEDSKESYVTSRGVDVEYVNLNTFAELIVKECVNTIKSNWDNIDESIDLYKVLTQDIYIAAVRDECCAEIKKHFGVEEE
jgi:hypothetical protein